PPPRPTTRKASAERSRGRQDVVLEPRAQGGVAVVVGRRERPRVDEHHVVGNDCRAVSPSKKRHDDRLVRDAAGRRTAIGSGAQYVGCAAAITGASASAGWSTATFARGERADPPQRAAKSRRSGAA